jgi:putative phosphoesterase
MRVAALYDIHGNLPALEAVLREVRNAEVDLIVVGGDVLPGPMPEETLSCLRELDIPARFIYGNGEVAVLEEIAGLGQVLFCHATPQNESACFTRLTPADRLLPVFEHLGVAVVVCGHTHMQFDRMIGGTRVVNAGSVGMPFGKPGADWLLLGPGVELRHAMYDLGKAAARIRDTDYPEAEEFAAQYVLDRPSEETMLQAFTNAHFK